MATQRLSSPLSPPLNPTRGGPRIVAPLYAYAFPIAGPEVGSLPLLESGSILARPPPDFQPTLQTNLPANLTCPASIVTLH